MTLVDSNRLLRGFGLARLGGAVLLLALGPLLPEEMMPGANRSILALTLLTIAITSGGLVAFTPIARPLRITWLIFLLDSALVTAVVAATGGPRSIFAFLYVLSVTAACLLLSRTGGLTIAAVDSLLYTGLVFGRTVFPMTAFFEAPKESTALELVTMFLNAGTFLIVAIVAGGLAERFRSTREELETEHANLKDLEAFTDLVFHSVGTGLIAVDGEHRVTALNRAAEQITGVSAQAAVGRAWSVFGDAVSLPAIEAELAERSSVWREVTLRRPGGDEAPVRMTFSELRAGDGRRIGVIAACEDLSTIRAMEARMRAADRLATLGRMAANIAHEIRNPLASLSGAVEVLAAGGQADDTRERLAQIVQKETERLNGIIRDFLEYARPVPLNRAPVNVAEIADEVLVLVEHRAAPGTLKIVREFRPTVVWSVDRQQLRQALWNLCVNALQAMPEGGELKVSMGATAGRLTVRLTDTGEGIAADDLGHIFEPFFSTKPGGSGLGLALVHRIVQDHGGEVDVQSRHGVGTAFTLTLPADA
ncbi:MAG TPA: ATP-binding protein [Methylomirabilota bacterium]|nr:ATP-binding protein [Methylomirabilota bacterium]